MTVTHTFGIIDKKSDTQPNFNKFLKTVDLQKTNKLVTDFFDISRLQKLLVCLSGLLTRLQNISKKLAAEFLKSKDA